MASSKGHEPDYQNSNIQLKCTSHQSTVFQALQSLFSSENLVDVTLAAEGKFIRAHKIVLSACSPYFRDLLSIDVSKHPIVFMSADTKFKELQAILNYMYKGETKVNHQDLSALLKLATTLQVRGLAESVTEPSDPVTFESMGFTPTQTSIPECSVFKAVEPPARGIPPDTSCNTSHESPQNLLTYFESVSNNSSSMPHQNTSTDTTPSIPYKRSRLDDTALTSTPRITQSKQEITREHFETRIVPNEVIVNPDKGFEPRFLPELTEVKMELGLLDEQEDAEAFQLNSNLIHNHGESVGEEIDNTGESNQFDVQQTPGLSHSTVSSVRDSGARCSVFEVGKHFLEYHPLNVKSKRPTKRCVICTKNKKRKETSYKCKACNVALCITPCFEIFHSSSPGGSQS